MLHLTQPHRTKLAVAALALAACAAGVTTATASPTADQKVDGVIVVAGNTCGWTNARTSANPPTALTVDRSSINKPGGNLTCDGSITASLNNNPAFTFDDTAATARTDLIDITGQQSFVSCRYKATNIVWDRDGTTRKYVNRAFTATKTSGSFLCPGSVTTAAGGASMLFH
ncbi:hypothetical protein ACFZBM_09715 [Streptomyces lavendulae]|uniref:Uncharacterized protein n=1 Tax=Streptomyces lavendulae subsp. lavendulae TaxID=58340 RepID=A0A2K8PP80_STRLA|nr:hypothetical protein [Streptomyces lavendulae]ATZ28547.1 hypothetical protein SLAV_33880 [Streptomyces lavendulae subsp. lavendulae]QUQ58372.1 hypothetical protein SLLC_32050 [Streptomyces lavendulae subsp. lavendulae]